MSKLLKKEQVYPLSVVDVNEHPDGETRVSGATLVDLTIIVDTEWDFEDSPEPCSSPSYYFNVTTDQKMQILAWLGNPEGGCSLSCEWMWVHSVTGEERYAHEMDEYDAQKDGYELELQVDL